MLTSIGLSLWASLIGCGNDPNRQAGPVHRVEINGYRREFSVSYPDSISGRAEVPVVFMFHGTSGNGQQYYNVSGWKEVGEREGFISVFPTALTYCFGEDDGGPGDFSDPTMAGDGVIEGKEWRVTTKWAAGKLGEDFPLCPSEVIAGLREETRNSLSTLRFQNGVYSQELQDDVAFFHAMLDGMQGERALIPDNAYPVDPDRVYVAGFSNGGEFTWRLSMDAADRIAAISTVGGSIDPDLAEVMSPLRSSILVVGTRDDRFLKLGVDPATPDVIPSELPLDESILDLIAFDAAMRQYTEIGALENDYVYEERTTFGGRRGVFVYDQSLVGADNQFQFWMIDNATHQYPNGENHPFKAAEAFWTFFGQYRR